MYVKAWSDETKSGKGTTVENGKVRSIDVDTFNLVSGIPRKLIKK
jgi:hypothetical protein